MIKKIILLALSFAFTVTSVVYSGVTKADPVSSGKGTGVSEKIENATELSAIMAQIPSFNDYSANESIKETYPDFKSFTMIETGYAMNESESLVRREVENEDGETESVPHVKRTVETTNHQLSISFTENAVYYHSIGSRITANEYYECEEKNSEYTYYDYRDYTFSDDSDFVNAERTVITFDAEIYHSKSQTLIKYNEYETVNEVATDIQRYKLNYVPAPEETDLSAEELAEKELQAKVDKIRRDNYGVWLKLETYTEEELAEKFGDMENPDPNISQEAYIDKMIEYMVYETCSLVSERDAESFATANANNCLYLTELSSFLTSDEVTFEQHETAKNQYDLVKSELVATGNINGETGEPEYEMDEVGLRAYISTILGSTYTNENRYHSYGDLSYVFGSDVAVIKQMAQWNEISSAANQSLTKSFRMDTITHFTAVNNSIANLGNARVKTVTEAYGNGLRAIFRDYIQNAMSKEGN